MASTINASTTLGLVNSADTSGVLQLQTANTAAVTIDASQNVGVGTSSPAYKLDVTSASDASLLQIKSTASANNTAMRFGIDGNNSFINASGGSTGVLQLRVFGTTQATLDASGNLGLGVTPSAWYSTVKAFQFGAGGLLDGRTNDAAQATFGAGYYLDSSATYRYISTTGATRFVQASGAYLWFTAPSGTAGNAISFTQAMTLDASGALILNNAGGDANMYFGGSSGTNRMYLARSGVDSLLINVETTGALRFGTNGSERARILSSGEFLVSTTTSFGVGVTIFTPDSGGSYSNATSTAARNHWRFANANGAVGSIQTSGSLTLYNTTSDYRLKTVIGAVTGHGERIDALEPIEYEWKSDGARTRGFLAHKFQEMYPQSVSGEKDAVDADGNPVYQNMQASTSEVIADLVAEIQSLRQRLAVLEGK